MRESVNWEIEVAPEGARVCVRGRFDENADFEPLVAEVARSRSVQFDVSGVASINSWGARQWILFLRSLPASIHYAFVDASTEFVKHCNMVSDMLGTGTMQSFNAPFVCQSCQQGSEQRLETAAVIRQLARRELPRFPCACGGAQELDDVPERLFAFLRA